MRTFSFILKAKKHDHYYITLKISEKNGITNYVPTSLQIEPGDWDESGEAPKNIYLKKNKHLYRKLNRIKIDVAHYFKSVEFTHEEIAVKHLEHLVRNSSRLSECGFAKESLLFFMHNYITARKHLLTGSTYKRYWVFLNLFERFEGYRSEHIMLHDINASLIKEFMDFGKEASYSDNTLSRSVGFMRTILNHLEKKGTRTTINEVEIPRYKKNQTSVILSEEELLKIKEAKVSKELEAARDWLIISCYTGQRISDFMRFDQSMVETIAECSCLSFVQRKTGKQIILPLHPMVEEVLLKNNGGFPPRISHIKYNEHIKEVAREAGIAEEIVASIRQGHRNVLDLIPKWKAVTSHIGRRSFATNFYGKIPTSLLIVATGHSSEAMFQKYVNRLNEEHVKALSNYFKDTHKTMNT